MSKKRVRLTESDLHNIIKESVKGIIKEDEFTSNNNYITSHRDNTEKQLKKICDDIYNIKSNTEINYCFHCADELLKVLYKYSIEPSKKYLKKPLKESDFTDKLLDKIYVKVSNGADKGIEELISRGYSSKDIYHYSNYIKNYKKQKALSILTSVMKSLKDNDWNSKNLGIIYEMKYYGIHNFQELLSTPNSINIVSAYLDDHFDDYFSESELARKIFYEINSDNDDLVFDISDYFE